MSKSLTLDEIREAQVTICLETGMFSLGDVEALLINGLLNYHSNSPDISDEGFIRALRYVANRIEDEMEGQ